MSSEERGDFVGPEKPQQPDQYDKLVADTEDLIVKMKVEEENMKNLIQSAGKCDNNNETDDSMLSNKVNSLNISRENTPDEGAADSSVILNKENQSLRSILAAYDSDTSSSSSSSSEDEDEEDSLDSEDDSDDSESSNSDSVLDFVGESQGAIKKRDKSGADQQQQDSFMTELGLDVLPPVPDLSTLSLENRRGEFFHMGHVRGIIQRIVTVEALPNIPAYDLDTPLFYGEGSEKNPLGLIFEVIGQVSSPTYAVRFNSAQDIKDAGIEKGIRVFSLPKSSMTNYVFVQELLKMKGSDASWIGDVEVPEELQEFSDDEAERMYKSASKQNRKRPHCSQERYKKYEKTMNRCNSLNTRVHRLIDARNTVRGGVFQGPNATNKPDWNSPGFEISSQNPSGVQGCAIGPSMVDFSFFEGRSGPSTGPKMPHMSVSSNPNITTYENVLMGGPWQNNRATSSTASRVPRGYPVGFYPYATGAAIQGDNDAGAWVNIPNMPPPGETTIAWTSNVPPQPPVTAPQGIWSVNPNEYQQGDPYKYP